MTYITSGNGKYLVEILILGIFIYTSGCPITSHAIENLSTRNFQINSSFEYSTNSDIPDFWFHTTVIGGLGSEWTTTRGYTEFHDKWRLDASQRYDGIQSLSLQKPLCLIGSEIPVPISRREPIVASVYLKAEEPETMVQIGLGKRLDSNRGANCVATEVKVGTSWERYQVKLTERDEDLYYFFIIPKSEGRIWVDAIQLEAGELPTQYTPSMRDKVFNKPFFSDEQATDKYYSELLSRYTPKGNLILATDFNNENLPESFKYSPMDWKLCDGAFCRINSTGNSFISLSLDNQNIGYIEFRFRLIKKDDQKEDSFLYLDYKGGTIRANLNGNVMWLDMDLYKQDKNSAVIIVKKELDPGVWHSLKVICRNNSPIVYVDGEYMLTGGPFCRESDEVSIGTWMMAAELDDIKVYSAETEECINARNYQFNSGFESAASLGIPDFWFQKVLAGGVEGWANNKGYAELSDKWNIDTSEAYEGKQSLVLEKPFYLVGSELRLPHNRHLVASVYLKATLPETQVRIGLGERLDDKGDIIGVSTNVKVGASWRRYIVNIPDSDAGLLRFFVIPESEGRVWVDAVQVESGAETTPYFASNGIPAPSIPSYTNSILQHYKTSHSTSPEEVGIRSAGLLEIFTEYSYYTEEKEARLTLDLNMPEKTKALYAITDILSKSGESIIKLENELDKTSGRLFVELPLAKCSPHGSPYDVKVTVFKDKNIPVLTATTSLVVLPSAKTEVKINRLNRGIYVNGKPFIPYTTFQFIPNRRDEGANQIAFLKESGMNTLFFPGYWASNETVDAYLDEAARQDMFAIVFYDMAPGRKHNGSEIFSWLKNKQAIIAVDVADEVGGADQELDWVYEAIRLGKEIIPHIMVFLNHNVIGLHLFENQPKKTPGDIYSVDYYPVSPSLTQIGPTDTLYSLETVMQLLNDASISKRMPMNYWMQSGWAINRGITPVEVEWLNYLSLIYGTRSFAYYIGVPQSDVLWRRIGEISQEIEVLKPALFSQEDHPDIRAANTQTRNQIKFISKKDKGDIYLLTVNRRMKKCVASFDLSKIGTFFGNAEVLFEKRNVNIVNGRLEDNFEPLRRHVYLIKQNQ